MTEGRHIAIVGASGVIGSAAVEHFSKLPGWDVTALSRRQPVVCKTAKFRHVSIDLADRAACTAQLFALPPISHLVYAAVREASGLVGGWIDTDLIELNGRMFANLLDPVAATGHLRHLSLLQGTKAYGAHLHSVETPLRESAPRDDHANFYWLHEDHARRCATQSQFNITIFRPQVLFGSAPGAAMNPVAAIGAYAAICREIGAPFVLPGEGEALFEAVDAGLLAEAFAWAATNELAANQTFNITNGDVFVLRQSWPRLASSFGCPTQGPAVPSFAEFFARAASVEAWSALAARHGLREANLGQLLGQSHHYLDLLTSRRSTQRALPLMLSTIKLRQAGFGACRDSEGSLLHWLRRMTELQLLPDLEGPP